MLGDAVKRAQAAHRSIIEQVYFGSCQVYGLVTVTDPESRVSKQREVPLLEGIPCHLSHSGGAPAVNSDTITVVSQTIQLFLPPEPVIPSGSRIEVTQNGRTESYGQSGKAAVYATHQEIPLELWKGYA